jgi:hypothetical protein
VRSASAGLALAAAALAGCGQMGLKNPEPTSSVRVVQTVSYPELPDIPLPPEPQLLPWEYEVPRDLSRKVPRNAPECLRVADKDRDDAYWDQCGENPVIRDSNVLFGLDQRNWNVMLSNFSKLREYITQLKARVELGNEARREWRRRAEEERRRADAALQPAAGASAPK